MAQGKEPKRRRLADKRDSAYYAALYYMKRHQTIGGETGDIEGAPIEWGK